MVERSLSMREVPGSIPGASTHIFFVHWNLKIIIETVFAEHYFIVRSIFCQIAFVWTKYIRTRCLQRIFIVRSIFCQIAFVYVYGGNISGHAVCS